MSAIDEIEASADTVMSEELSRLFKYAGCSPTTCHACRRMINVGDTFKLVPHAGTDEMCCVECDEAALVRRDRRAARRAHVGGFSRASRGAKP